MNKKNLHEKKFRAFFISLNNGCYVTCVIFVWTTILAEILRMHIYKGPSPLSPAYI